MPGFLEIAKKFFRNFIALAAFMKKKICKRSKSRARERRKDNMMDSEIRARLEEQDIKNRMEISKKMAEGQMEIEKAVLKEKLLNAEKLDYEQNKNQMQEYKKEVTKMNYLEIGFGTQGEVELHTKNALVKVPECNITNFLFKGIEELICSDGRSGFYKLFLLVNSRNEEVYLDRRKIGKAEYLLEKITGVGGRIHANKKTVRDDILLNFVAKLVEICEEEKIIPANIGWIKIPEKNYKFIQKGELLWKDIVENAK